MARNRDLGKLPYELKGGAGKTILSKVTSDDYDFEFRSLQAGDMPTGIDAANIGAGGVSNTEFGYLDGVTSNIQTQINNAKGLKSGTASGTDTYAVSISGVTAYTDGDAYLVRFTNGNTGSCTLNINSLGAKTLYRNNDGALIGGDIVAGGEMLCVYNSSGNYFQTIGTAPNTLLSYVTNAESVTITKGQVVYAFGGQGDRMTVKLAYNTTDATSAQTVGIVLSASIGANQKGLIMMQGLLDGLSILPTSTFADGDTIYLDSTAGSITNVKPYAPNHLVYLGVVTTASNGSAGRMYVRVQNGYELDELHNVQAQSPTANDTLYYFGSNQWKTASIPTILGYTPVTNARTISTTSPLSGGGDLSANRTLSIAQATTSASGYLSSTDWNTFNGKQAALSGSGIVKSTGGTISYLTDNSTNWDTAYTNRITSLTTTGSSGSATLVSNVLNIPTYTLAGLGGQPLATNLTSLSGLSYSSASFVKMTAAGTFSLDTATYLTGNQTITLSGDVSGSGTTAITTTIGANKVTVGMMAQAAANSILGNNTGSVANVSYLTGTQVTAMLDAFTSSLRGIVPASGGGTTNFLRADGTWAAPSGGGGGTPGGSDNQIQYNSAGSFAGSSSLVWDNANTRLGIAQSTPTSRFHLNFNVNSETQSDANGILLANSTAAISGTQSISPAIVWQGNGWKTLSTAASQDVRFRADMLPTQGAVNPSGTWRIASNINNAGYTTVMSVSSGGAFYATSVNSGSQFGSDQSGSSTIKVFKLTNAGVGSVTPQLLLKGFGTTAGILGVSWDDTNQLTFHASNGTSQIARAAIQIVSLANGAGAETGDLAFFTQTGGTAIAERMRIFANGNVSIGGTSNAGYKLDVAGQTRLQFDVTISDTRNFIFSTSSGTKFGTATGQKIAFWNKTPIIQPTTSTTAATFVANTSLIANDTATFGGYTIGQVVAALINVGILA
jgi:hypothetical protein